MTLIADQRDMHCFCCSSETVCDQKFGYSELTCINCGFVHYSGGKSITSQDYSKSEKYQNYTAENKILWYHRKALEQISKSERVHDFGCHNGFFVKFLIDQNINASGSDWDTNAIDSGIIKFGLRGKLTVDPTEKYDTIVSCEVLEHFENPDAFFHVCNNHLKDNGKLLISVPNKLSIYRPGVDYPPHHFSRFTEEALARLAKKHGYTILNCHTELNLQMLLRNYFGDKLRKKPISFSDNQYSNHYYLFKYIYNKFSFLPTVLFEPICLILKIFGLRYGSIFMTLQKKNE